MMASHIIPEDVAQFVADAIDSVAQLEALLLLRNSPQEKWTNESLANRLYISPKQTNEVLMRLCATGLVASDGNEPIFRYCAVSIQLDNTVQELAQLYAKHLVAITNLIHSKPKTRVQEFADAFRLRKEE